MSRRTFTEKRSYSARVMRFRKAVYAEREGMTNGCRVLLLRLSDDMDASGKVSVPRSALAADLGVATARITENIKLARSLGFLDIVRRGRPGVTAVYSGQTPAPLVRPAVLSERYARADQAEVRPAVPGSEPTWYAVTPTQEEVPAATNVADPFPGLPQRGQEEEAVCRWHGFAACPKDCADRPTNRRRTA